LLSAESVNKVCEHVAEGSEVGIMAAKEFEQDIDHYEAQYTNFTAQMHEYVAEIQIASDFAKEGMVGIADAIAATADAAVREELLDQAEAFFTTINAGLERLEAFNSRGRTMAAAMAGTVIYEGHYGSLAVDINTLAYIADQAELALELLDSAATEMKKYCAGNAWYSDVYQYNCTNTMLPRVVGIPHTNFRPVSSQSSLYKQAPLSSLYKQAPLLAI
jgi:hypothetical protein